MTGGKKVLFWNIIWVISNVHIIVECGMTDEQPYIKMYKHG